MNARTPYYTIGQAQLAIINLFNSQVTVVFGKEYSLLVE